METVIPDTPFQLRRGLHNREIIRLEPSDVPVIDFGRIYCANEAEHKELAGELRDACTGPGYFYITNHQFPQSVIDRAHSAMKRFFALPLEEKMKTHYLEWPNHRGYVPLHGIQADHSLKGNDISEAIEMADDLPEDDSDYLRGLRFYGPNNWPTNPPEFRWALGTYYDCQIELGRSIYRAFELALDLEPGYFTSKYNKPLSRTRVCYYPPQGEDFDIAHIGLGAHTDYECFTTVWQNDVPGLQMLTLEGDWYELPAIPGTFAVNLGDLMQKWTNDYFVSTAHRVINTQPVERYSLVQFFGVDYDVLVEALPGRVSTENPWKYEAIKAGEHSERMVARTYGYDGGD
ncbi:MAG: 2OG-Fe(II) oxygenase [Rhodospirillaceae bacterium]|nr:2OG-Fe(II) oxygenase [Rhodospirillaceae bacterium]